MIGMKTVEWECPYCGGKNKTTVPDWYISKTPAVVSCDVDSGGCDRMAVVTIKMQITTEARKIEGEE
jgi:hypothetical protein